MNTFPPRHAFSRARFFPRLCEGCTIGQRDYFEAFLEASIIFARASLHRLQSEFKDRPEWKPWWDSLLQNRAVTFFRAERDWILTDGPPKIGQIIGAPSVRARDFYYYEDPSVPATETVENHLTALEKVLLDAQSRFG